MTASITEQQRSIEAAARSLAVKFKSFHDELTPVEHAVFNVALRSIGGELDADADVSGYKDSLYDCAVKVATLERFVNAASLGFLHVGADWSEQGGCQLDVYQ
jgi:hypothetical protein